MTNEIVNMAEMIVSVYMIVMTGAVYGLFFMAI